MLNKISDLIVDVARREDLILRRVGKGVLLIPELAFSYAVGRELASNAEDIFGTIEVTWKLESLHEMTLRIWIDHSRDGTTWRRNGIIF